MIKNITIMLIMLLMIGCNTTKKEESTSLLGVVYDYKSNPVNSANIKFTNNNNVIEVTTDIDGKFFLPELDFGEYKVDVTAEKCSTTTTNVNHFNSENILIIRLNTYDDLLLKFKDLVLLGDYELAKTIIPQIEEIDLKDVSYQYIKSIYLIETGSYEEAESILKELELKTLGEAYISILLADLYQYHLKDNSLAIKYLKKYLSREYTLKESNRLKELLNVEVN